MNLSAPLLERVRGFALAQSGDLGAARAAFDASLHAGRARRDDYEVEKVAAFAARHFAHLDGGSTDRVIDQLIVGR